MSTCRICGETLPMNRGSLKYGAKVHLCPRCRTPYVDPKIIELATVSDCDRAGYRLKFATRIDRRLVLFASVLLSLVSTVFLSQPAVHSALSMLLVFAAVYVGILTLSFCVKFFLIFPKLARESAKRMADVWYLTRLKACYTKAA